MSSNMSSYCLKGRKNTESINPRLWKTDNSKAMILWKCAICGSKKSRFIKKQEACGVLNNLGLKTPLNKIPLLRDTFFECNFIERSSSECNYKREWNIQ